MKNFKVLVTNMTRCQVERERRTYMHKNSRMKVSHFETFTIICPFLLWHQEDELCGVTDAVPYTLVTSGPCSYLW